MAGKMCPECGEQTFFSTPTGRKCTRCGLTMTVPANEGKGGRGYHCANCGEHKVREGRCRGCGAIYS